MAHAINRNFGMLTKVYVQLIKLGTRTFRRPLHTLCSQDVALSVTKWALNTSALPFLGPSAISPPLGGYGRRGSLSLSRVEPGPPGVRASKFRLRAGPRPSRTA